MTAAPVIAAARRVLSENSTNSTALSSIEGITVAPPAGMIDVSGFRGVRQLLPYGTDADGETFDLWLYGVSRIEGAEGVGSNFHTLKLAEIAVTIGTKTGVADGLLTADDRLAKALTVTKTEALSQWIEALYGSSLVDADLSTDHGLHAVAIPDLGNLHGLVCAFSNNGKTAASMNALLQLST